MPDTRPVVAWILATFEPLNPDTTTEEDRYAVVEDGVDRCYVRWFGDLRNTDQILTDDLAEGYGLGGRIRIFDLNAPVERCELLCSARVSTEITGALQAPDTATARSSAPDVVVLCVRDPEHANEFEVLTDGRVQIVDIDLGGADLTIEAERDEFLASHEQTACDLERAGSRLAAQRLRELLEEVV